jgi:uncharacterized Tic20 family protein
MILRFIQVYYLATPVFFLADLLFNASIRVSFIESASMRYAYYGFCLFCGLVSYLLPPFASLVGLFESSLNILLLVLGIMVPIHVLPGQVLEGQPGGVAFTGRSILNFGLSATILTISFQARLTALRTPAQKR